MFGEYFDDEKRLERRARTTYDLLKLIRQHGCKVETTEQGGAPKADQAIGFREGNIENSKLVKVQPGNFRVPEGYGSIRVFISTRGQPFGLFEAIRKSDLFISDVFTHSQHVETEIGEDPEGNDEVRVLDVTAQLTLKFEDEHQ